MLHLLDHEHSLRPPQQALHIPLARAEAHAAHSEAPAEALRALDELIRVRRPLPVQGPPLARPAAHVAGSDARPGTLPAEDRGIGGSGCCAGGKFRQSWLHSEVT